MTAKQSKLASLSAEDQGLIDLFLDSLWVERGVSDHTLKAYGSDLQGLALSLAQKGKGLRSATREDLLDYLAKRVQQGAKPRTTARLLSSQRHRSRHLNWVVHYPNL